MNRLAAFGVAALLVVPMCGGPRPHPVYQTVCVVTGDPGAGWTWREGWSDWGRSLRSSEDSARSRLFGRRGWSADVHGASATVRNTSTGQELEIRFECGSQSRNEG